MHLINKEFVNNTGNIFLTENVSLFLYSLIKTCRPKNILEIGAGYSTHFIIKAIEDIQNDDYEFLLPKESLIENHEQYTNSYNPNFTIVDNFHWQEENIKRELLKQIKQSAPYSVRLKFVEMCAKDFVLVDESPYDFVWVDFGDGTENEYIFHKFFKNLEEGGFIIIHHTCTTLIGKLFLAEMSFLNKREDLFEMMSFVEPHKTRQNSFTVFKKLKKYPTYEIYS